jgi:hypothetical protein
MEFYGADNCFNPKDYTHIIAVGETSYDNNGIGEMWLETKSFNKDASIGEVIKWAAEIRISGRLIITIDESTVEEKE